MSRTKTASCRSSFAAARKMHPALSELCTSMDLGVCMNVHADCEHGKPQPREGTDQISKGHVSFNTSADCCAETC